MGKRAATGTDLSALVRMALPLLREAERRCPRTGPGAKPEIPDWLMGVLIMVAVLKRKKSKSSQFRFLADPDHRRQIAAVVKNASFPSRSTFFRRYRRAHQLFQSAIRVQGERAVTEGVADPKIVAIDKSLIAARGPLWHKRDRQAHRIPKGLRGVDRDSRWGCSQHDGWVQGYSVEVMVSATPKRVVFPLLASADTASAKETSTVIDKLSALPAATRSVLVDSGYDSNEAGERIEYGSHNRRTGRRFLCPENPRNSRPASGAVRPTPRDEHHRRRLERRRFLNSRAGRRLYAQRGQTVEPFHDWFKSLFELDHRVWHRGLDNNRTQLLAAVFVYQLLVRHNHRRGHQNGRVKWIMDAL